MFNPYASSHPLLNPNPYTNGGIVFRERPRIKRLNEQYLIKLINDILINKTAFVTLDCLIDTDQFLRIIRAVCDPGSNVQHLDIYGSPEIQDEPFIIKDIHFSNEVIDLLNKNTKLTSIRLIHCKVTVYTTIKLKKMLNSNYTLTYLELQTSVFIDQKHFEEIETCLERNNEIQTCSQKIPFYMSVLGILNHFVLKDFNKIMLEYLIESVSPEAAQYVLQNLIPQALKQVGTPQSNLKPDSTEPDQIQFDVTGNASSKQTDPVIFSNKGLNDSKEFEKQKPKKSPCERCVVS